MYVIMKGDVTASFDGIEWKCDDAALLKQLADETHQWEEDNAIKYFPYYNLSLTRAVAAKVGAEVIKTPRFAKTKKGVTY